MDHNDNLRYSVRSELLLEYHVQQEWGPLCEFLGKDVPACEFPRSNDRDSFWKGCRSRDARVARTVMIKVLLLAAGLAGLLWWLRGQYLKP